MAELEDIGKWSFIPKDEQEKDEPAEFVCQHLTPSEWADAVRTRGVAQSAGSGEVQILTNKDQLVRKAVLEIRNVSLGGKAIVTVHEFLQARHPTINAWFEELVNEIVERNRQQGDDLKN